MELGREVVAAVMENEGYGCGVSEGRERKLSNSSLLSIYSVIWKYEALLAP